MSTDNLDYILEEDNAPNTYISKSEISGYGLFASKQFMEKEIIIDFFMFPKSIFVMKFSELSEEQIRKNWYIAINDTYCVTNDKFSKFSYINHSRTPNCFWNIKNGLILAYSKIEKGSELFIDYRLEFRPNRTNLPTWL